MEQITRAQRIAILAHERPDGDCLGSALGLSHILQCIDKQCVPVCADTPGSIWSFMPGIETFWTSLGDERFDLIIALDAGELDRFGSIAHQHQAFLDRVPIINIDHHISSQGCGQVNIIDPTAAATAELLVLFQQQAGLPLPTEAAICLMTGLMTDTGSFQYPSTTARTMEAGALLIQAGATPETIAQPIFRTRSLALARFQAAVINNAHSSCAGRLLWSYATGETLRAAGAEADMDDNFSGMLRDIEGVKIAAFFKNYEDTPQTRLSLRTAAPYDAAAICVRYGGGGHVRAAGATLMLPLQEAMTCVVKDLEAELNRRPPGVD
jgi:phosphoesterase RecJ-like protein